MKKLIKISIFIIICLAGRVNGETYYVKTDGDNTRSGLSWENAWQNPSYAAIQAQAGDMVYLQSTTWNNEHIILANSGTEGNPITFAGYGGKAILDGMDKTGIGIRAVGKSFFTISGVHIKDYYEGISIEDTTTGMVLDDFIIERTQRSALIFKGTGESVASNIIISNFVMYETGWDGYPAISHEFGWNSHDIRIFQFEIRDTYGEGINWRFSQRVHIYDGKIYNTASDAIHLQLCVDDSIVENMWIKNTGWHGIAIHDHTVGDYPCHNNIIRNCYVGYASHNDIDLHSGAYNTIVENCTLDGTPTTGQGIYFHNLGAGLIARNNTIYNTGDGIDGGPLPGEYLGDILIEDNILYNLTNGICFQSGTEDVIIKGNLVYNTEVPISVSGDNILIEENDIKEKTYRINTGKGKVKNALDKSYFVRSSWGAEITVGYTGGQVFDYEITYNDGDNSYTEPVWGPQGSEFTLKSTLEEECNGIIAKIITYPIKMMTVEGLATVKVNNIDFFVSQGESIIDFTVQATDGKNVIFIIEDLTPGKFYKVKKDNNFYTTEQANREGLIQFENSEWIREHRFEIEEIPTGRIEENKISLFPNPYVANRDTEGIIKFGNLPPEARIRIYTIKGEEIAIIENKSFVDGDSISWNVSNIASGVYIYYLDSAQRKEKGKVSIIK